MPSRAVVGERRMRGRERAGVQRGYQGRRRCSKQRERYAESFHSASRTAACLRRRMRARAARMKRGRCHCRVERRIAARARKCRTRTLVMRQRVAQARVERMRARAQQEMLLDILRERSTPVLMHEEYGIKQPLVHRSPSYAQEFARHRGDCRRQRVMASWRVSSPRTGSSSVTKNASRVMFTVRVAALSRRR